MADDTKENTRRTHVAGSTKIDSPTSQNSTVSPKQKAGQRGMEENVRRNGQTLKTRELVLGRIPRHRPTAEDGPTEHQMTDQIRNGKRRNWCALRVNNPKQSKKGTTDLMILGG